MDKELLTLLSQKTLVSRVLCGMNYAKFNPIYYFTVVVVEFEPTLYTVPETDDAIFRIVKRNTTTENVTVLFSTSPGSAEGRVVKHSFVRE